MWSLTGLILAAIVATVSWRSSRSGGRVYDPHHYGIDAPAHRTYAALSVAFAAVFLTTYVRHAESAGVAALALYALVVIFYATSFLRGASHE